MPSSSGPVERVVEEQEDASDTEVTWDIDNGQAETGEPSTDPAPEPAPQPAPVTGDHRYPSRVRNASDRYGH